MLEFLNTIFVFFASCFVLYIYKKWSTKPENVADDTLLRKMLDEYKPEPLLPPDNSPEIVEEQHVLDRTKVIDLIHTDFLSFSRDPAICDVATETIRSYGVGTCGPRSFLGTSEVHIQFEKKLAALYGNMMALIYSYGCLTVSSVIGMYATFAEAAFVDELVNQSIIDELRCHNAKIYYFKHNNPYDLSVLMESVLTERKRSRLLILEGIYKVNGAMCKLRDFTAIARKHKLDVVLDETYSFGVIGANGLGITEYLNCDPETIILCGSFEHTLGIYGGYCVGKERTVEVQQILSLSYVYSASLSAFLVESLRVGLDLLPDRSAKLQLFARQVHDFLFKFNLQFDVLSHASSALKVIGFKNIFKKDRDWVAAEILQVSREKCDVYMLKDKAGFRFHLNYNLILNNHFKERLFEALQLSAGVVAKHQF